MGQDYKKAISHVNEHTRNGIPYEWTVSFLHNVKYGREYISLLVFRNTKTRRGVVLTDAEKEYPFCALPKWVRDYVDKCGAGFCYHTLDASETEGEIFRHYRFRKGEAEKIAELPDNARTIPIKNNLSAELGRLLLGKRQ